MSCPECANRFREYLIFRSAVVRFANHLDDLENERRRILEENRSDEAPPLVKVKAKLRTKFDNAHEQELGTLTSST